MVTSKTRQSSCNTDDEAPAMTIDKDNHEPDKRNVILNTIDINLIQKDIAATSGNTVPLPDSSFYKTLEQANATHGMYYD